MAMALKFDIEAIALAKEQLDIRRPVKILTARHISRGVVGNHQYKDGKHIINLLDPQVTPNYTLWHELAHCAQSEQYDSFDETYQSVARLALGGLVTRHTGYILNPFELDANKIAQENSPTKILVTRY